jgi:hypothetical protein
METLDDDIDYTYEINSENPFLFNRLSLENPEPISNGFYFIKLLSANNPLYIQMPKCNMKNGIVSNKKEKYSDLLYLHKDNTRLIDWIEKLETKCKDMIDNKKKVWFQSDLTRDDLDTMLTPSYRMYKSGANVLLRAYIDIDKQTGKDKCLVYDESQNMLDVLRVDNDREIIPLLHLEGIRFSSKTFEIDIKIIQIMIMNKTIDESVCMIKKTVITDEAQNVTVVKTPEVIQPLEEIKLQAKQQHNEQVQAKQHDQVMQAKQHDQVMQAKQHDQVMQAKQHDQVKENHKSKTDWIQQTEQVKEDVILEVSLDDLSNISEEILELKKPNQVYYKIYKAAREKALKMRQNAIEAFLEAKQIKTKYMLQHLDDSDDSEIENDYPDSETEIETEE